MENKKNWGGARKGSGRKKIKQEDKKVSVSFQISKDTHRKLKLFAAEEKKSVPKIVKDLIAYFLTFLEKSY